MRTVQARAPGLRLTLDPLEFRGFRYHTGPCVFIYSPGWHEELGRGGRYLSGAEEPATGLTLYPDAVLRVAPARATRPRAYLDAAAQPADAARLRAAGYATVAALRPDPDPDAEARRLGCTHILRDGAAVPLSPET